jgi:hypothetical protein
VDRCVLGKNAALGRAAAGRERSEDPLVEASVIVSATWMRLERRRDLSIPTAQSP